jgi:CDGSH-type Zn-finger protein
MSGYKVVKHGTHYSPHVLENEETSARLSLCACGCTSNADGTCDGTHNKKKASGCGCENCQKEPLKDNS